MIPALILTVVPRMATVILPVVALGSRILLILVLFGSVGRSDYRSCDIDRVKPDNERNQQFSKYLFHDVSSFPHNMYFVIYEP